MNDFWGVDCIKIDSRVDTKTVVEVKEALPKYKAKPVQQRMIDDPFNMPDYKLRCMDGCDHPLSIESQLYVLTRIHKSSIDTAVASGQQNYYRSNFNHEEIEYLKSIVRRPEVDWAMNNSFDGLYIQRMASPSSFKTEFSISCYMKEEHVTFWKLKYS